MGEVESATMPDLDTFLAEALQWLEQNAVRRQAKEKKIWGEGDDSVAIFHNMTLVQETELLRKARDWQARKFDAGYGAISWPTKYGGRGLPSKYEVAFRKLESGFETPDSHEVLGLTIGLVANTINVIGTPEQKEKYLRKLLRLDELACQLFSEPGAGSDLAGLSTRADRDGEMWVINGQKVWNSGAVHATWGEIICRSDPAAPKHAGMTAFIVDMDTPGVEVRPIRQITGGVSFNEVFFTNVRLPDSARLGAVGEGWKVALTTLGFERAGSGGGGARGGNYRDVLNLARWLDISNDMISRHMVVDLYARHRLMQLNAQRVAAAAKAGKTPGPEGSIMKVLATQQQQRLSNVVSHLLGPRLVADTGEWGTYAWAEYLLGAVGNRIAGGSDEIQRNILGERVLGLPSEPKVEK